MNIQSLLEIPENKVFKFSSANYNEEKNECVLLFLYSNNNKPTDEQKQSLTKNLQNLTENLCSLKVKFKQSYIDKEVALNLLNEFFQHNLPILLNNFTLNDITLEVSDEINISISCSENQKNIISDNNNLNELQNFIQSNFFEPVNIVFNTEKQDKKLSEEDYQDINANTDLMKCLEKEQEINIVSVADVEILIGKEITKPPVFIEDIGLDEKEEVSVAGFLTNFLETDFIPKSSKEKGETTTKKKISFTITDTTGSIDIIAFPNDKNLEIYRTLEDNQQVLVNGFVNVFGNRKSLRINAVSKCNILTLERQFVWRKEKPNYLCVKPEPMHDLVQMDLFSKQKNENSNFWNENHSVVVFDFETTGLNADNCQIIEIGAVKVVNGVCVETFSTLVNPNCAIPEEIEKITGISTDMIAFAPTIDLVLPDFYKFTKDSVLSAYNIGFDIKFLQNAGKKLRYNFNNKQIDTLELARNKIPSLHNYKLSTVVKALDIVLEDAHRALNDAVATAKVFIKLI